LKRKQKILRQHSSRGSDHGTSQGRQSANRVRTSCYLAAIIAFIALLVYLPALRNGFVSDWDDNAYVLENMHIRSLNLDFFRWAFSDTYAASYWHPLTWISHAVDYAFWGLNPLGHHLTSLLLHALNTGIIVCLVARLLEIVTEKTAQSRVFMDRQAILIAAGVTGLIFGLHPLKVESVAWIAQRKDLLYSLFYLLSITSYLRYASGPEGGDQQPFFRNSRYLATLALFVLALASKPMAVTLPAVLLLLDWYPLRRLASRKSLTGLLIEKLPFFMLSGIIAVASLMTQQTGGGLKSLEEATLPARLLVVCKGLMLYFWKILAPTDLLPFYTYPKHVSLAMPEYLGGVIFILGIFTVCGLMAKRQPAWLATWLYFLVTLFPVLGFFQAGAQAMADRYLYLPSLGLFVLLGSGAAWGWTGIRALPTAKKQILQPVVGVVVVTVFVALSYLTIKQIEVWKDNDTFWSSLIADYSRSIAKGTKDDLIYYQRGCFYYRDKKYDLAISDLNKAIELDPDNYDAYVHRGNSYMKMGMFDKAIEEYNTVIVKKPSHFMAYTNRAIAYEEKGEAGKALADYTKGLSLWEGGVPILNATYINRGDLYLKTGAIDLAIRDYQQACEHGSEIGCSKALFPFQNLMNLQSK